MRCEPVVTDISGDTSAEICGIFPGLMRAAGDRPGHNAAPEIVRDACPISSVLRISQIADKTDKPGVTCFILLHHQHASVRPGMAEPGETSSSYLIFWIIKLFLRFNQAKMLLLQQKRNENKDNYIFPTHITASLLFV